ncbi:MAG TPA: tetratricopeptide repeat protein [Thermoflexia bacterium]|nr:tetratricopeptide repeat protein [Thermoflexia bacterium]
METSRPILIRSKLAIPTPATLLHRPRVCSILEQGARVKLTIVSAPAGYGKTSALVDFARRAPLPVCWYTVDERDRDLGTFINYLVGAIAERFPGFGERTLTTLEGVSSAIFRDPTPVAGALTNEIADLAVEFVLIVDNFEEIDGAYGLRGFLNRLLEVLPANCHLMIGSRVLPEVPVTRLVAQRQLVGLAGPDLRFTPGEIRDLLELSKIEISAEEAEALAANAEGWIMGVLLLAGLLRDRTPTALLASGRVTTETYEYLAQEVLNRQPPDVQYFLYTSSVLREMSVRLCRRALQIEDAGPFLAEVERRNLFVTRFGAGPKAVYRYHGLFRDFLHQRLRRQDPGRYAELHLLAARWFEREDDVEEAVYHYLAAEAYSEATSLMEQVAMEWFTRGRTETLLRWAESLPEHVKERAPRLMLFQSRLLTDQYDYEGAQRALAYAEAGFLARGDVASLAKVYNQRATLNLFTGHYQEAMQEARTALETAGERETIERANAQRHIGRAYIGLGRLSEGIAMLEQALALFREAGSLYDVFNLLQDLTLAFFTQGRLEEAASRLNEALAIARRLGAPAQLAGVLNNLGWLHYVRGEYREALALYEEGLAAARRGNVSWLQANVLVGMADLYRDIGAYDRAEPLYHAGWQIAWKSEPGLAFYILLARADMYRWRGQRTRAFALLGQARQMVEGEGLDLEKHGLLPLAEGILLVEDGQVEAGIDLLAKAIRFLERRGARREAARARFLLAKAFLRAGRQEEALGALEKALALAAEIGTDQSIVVEGQHAEDLLQLGVAEGLNCQETLEKINRLRSFAVAWIRSAGPSEEKEEVGGRLEIYALGGGRVVRDGEEVSSSDWRAAMAKELFFYIVLNGPVERDAIGLVFWPDLPPKKMIDNFHSTLYRIRRAVGEGVIVVEEGRYRLGDVDYWFDVEEFEALVEQARLLPYHDWRAEDLWRRAVTLYQGDFLPEVSRLWCVPKREVLRQMYVEALIGVGRCHEARREWEEAIEWFRRALEVDRLREDVHRQIMLCYKEAGRRSEAIKQYHQCREILLSELGVEPSEETESLFWEIAGKAAG